MAESTFFISFKISQLASQGLFVNKTEKRRTHYFAGLSNYCSAENLFLSISIVFLWFGKWSFSALLSKNSLSFQTLYSHSRISRSRIWKNVHIKFCIAIGLSKKQTHKYINFSLFLSVQFYKTHFVFHESLSAGTVVAIPTNYLQLTWKEWCDLDLN